MVESAAVTVASVLYDTVRTARTQMRESADGLGRWLTEAFENLRAQPEGVYLLGSRGDLGLIAGPLEEALPIPVVATEEAQLVLARGAALQLGAAPAPQVSDDRATQPVKSRPRPARRVRFGSHARAATVLVAGAIALFAVVPELVGESESATPESRPSAASSEVEGASSSTTSVRVHTVPSAPAAPVAQPLAAAQAPSPAPPTAPPVAETAPVSEPAAIEAPVAEEVTAPVETVAPVESVAQPVEAVQSVEAAQPAVLAPAPVAAQPAAAPAPPGLPAVAPAPAPLAPPAANPLAPPDPIAAALSPIFGGLP